MLPPPALLLARQPVRLPAGPVDVIDMADVWSQTEIVRSTGPPCVMPVTQLVVVLVVDALSRLQRLVPVPVLVRHMPVPVLEVFVPLVPAVAADVLLAAVQSQPNCMRLVAFAAHMPLQMVQPAVAALLLQLPLLMLLAPVLLLVLLQVALPELELWSHPGLPKGLCLSSNIPEKLGRMLKSQWAPLPHHDEHHPSNHHVPSAGLAWDELVAAHVCHAELRAELRALPSLAPSVVLADTLALAWAVLLAAAGEAVAAQAMVPQAVVPVAAVALMPAAALALTLTAPWAPVPLALVLALAPALAVALVFAARLTHSFSLSSPGVLSAVVSPQLRHPPLTLNSTLAMPWRSPLGSG